MFKKQWCFACGYLRQGPIEPLPRRYDLETQAGRQNSTERCYGFKNQGRKWPLRLTPPSLAPPKLGAIVRPPFVGTATLISFGVGGVTAESVSRQKTVAASIWRTWPSPNLSSHIDDARHVQVPEATLWHFPASPPGT